MVFLADYRVFGNVGSSTSSKECDLLLMRFRSTWVLVATWALAATLEADVVLTAFRKGRHLVPFYFWALGGMDEVARMGPGLTAHAQVLHLLVVQRPLRVAALPTAAAAREASIFVPLPERRQLQRTPLDDSEPVRCLSSIPFASVQARLSMVFGPSDGPLDSPLHKAEALLDEKVCKSVELLITTTWLVRFGCWNDRSIVTGKGGTAAPVAFPVFVDIASAQRGGSTCVPQKGGKKGGAKW